MSSRRRSRSCRKRETEEGAGEGTGMLVAHATSPFSPAFFPGAGAPTRALTRPNQYARGARHCATFAGFPGAWAPQAAPWLRAAQARGEPEP